MLIWKCPIWRYIRELGHKRNNWESCYVKSEDEKNILDILQYMKDHVKDEAYLFCMEIELGTLEWMEDYATER